MRYSIKVEWQIEDGRQTSIEVGQLDFGACQGAADVGLTLDEVKPLLARLQEVVVTEQLRQHCNAARSCPSCQARRNVKDHRKRHVDTVFGTVVVDAPRFDPCRSCSGRRVTSPLSELLPERTTPELRHLQAMLAADLSYARATELLRVLLPATGGLTPVTTGHRTVVVGNEVERELCEEVSHPSVFPQAEHLTIGIDGAFVKARCDQPRQRRQFEILTGRIEAKRGGGEVFGVVRDLDRLAKQKVQAVLRRCGRGPETNLTVLSDGEEGLRGVVGWFGDRCEHRLDWFHINRRLERIGKDLLYLPAGEKDFGTQRSIHARNLESVKWMLWNDGVEMAEHGMTLFRIGLFQHAQECASGNRARFANIEAKLNELRSYLYANRESVRGYAEIYWSGERVSTAHVESTVNQLINWRFCKKRQANWTRAGAQALLHVKTAVINGRLERYTGHRERLAAVA